ncbi:DEPDC5 [Branchiostoma lanceolatum]|uniref:DEPDC5 protein n=1 Tax=Branchiostoma lanceolatum TaxID=7740 RepID=A0A8J9VES9_BRALA|nr:DEPDC5 [Branchiostoma lanceolatum]
MAAKVFKLYIHQETFSENDLVINSKDFPSAKVGDVVEIYQPEEPNRRLLLQVKALKGDSQQKGISVDKTVANVFQLRPFIDVCVNFVSPQDVALDLVELTFKDQYISRSDMWRLKKSLVSTCAYITKKVEFAGIRAQIGECWMRSEKVGSGVITEDTKIVFRSSTSMVYLFIQLSREMWEFDIHGDLYWEKACMFLKELFTRWKENNSNHEVTIVVFSRTFYDADSVDDFPQSMRKCLQVDYKGRICEDFYRVVAQAERMEDWSPMLVSLKRHFIQYPNKTRYCKDEGCPVGHNSTAAQGNFLEAINMSLNVFEKHFIARNFDRTGQITVLITPGAGVFEVDRELTNITKQRMIDNGIGSDLVCLAEQPLHAVPLFKFHNKSAENYLGDDYNIPHWINHSFYAPKSTESGSMGFVPRIKMAETKPDWKGCKDGDLNGLYQMRNPTTTSSTEDALSTMVDYDEYDAQVFKNPARSLGTSFPRTYGKGLMRHSSDDMLEAKAHAQLRGRSRHASDDHRNLTVSSSVRQERQRHMSEDLRLRIKLLKMQSSLAIKIPPSVPRKDSMQASSLGSLHNFQVTDHEEETKRFVVGSASPTDRSKLFPASAFPKVPTRKRALINPFAPSRLLVRLTSNRRRWTHTFPLGPTGEAMQHHHHKKSPVPEELAVAMDATSPPSKGMLDANMAAVEARKQAGLLSEETVENLHKSASLSSLGSDQGGGLRRVDSAGSVSSVINTYEISGVDWKSLTTPACLPITTDYFPEKHSLEYDYLESNYDLLADFEDSMEMENMEQGNRTRQTLNTQQVFTELISQRLMQGFQLIVLPKDSPLSVPQGHTTLSSSPRFSISRRKHRSEDQDEYWLSMGRNFHKVVASRSRQSCIIHVTKYKPRHPSHTNPWGYRFRLWPVYQQVYDPARTEFQHDNLENYNWNYLDNYICSSGGDDFDLMDSLKFWRTRFLLLPAMSASTKQLSESQDTTFDIYPDRTAEEQQQMMDGFLRFMEIVNRIRRPASNRKQKRGDNKELSTPTSGGVRRGGFNLSAPTTPTAPLSPLPAPAEKEQSSQQAKQVDSFPIPPSTNEGAVALATSNTENTEDLISDAMATTVVGEGEESEMEQEGKLTLTSPPEVIIKAMKDSTTGVGFLPDQRDLPANSFISAEAVAWVSEAVDGVVSHLQAVELLQKLVEDHYIVHASLNPGHPFCNGFFLYCILSEENRKRVTEMAGRQYPGSYSYQTDGTSFQSYWVEVSITSVPMATIVPSFLSPRLRSDSKETGSPGSWGRGSSIKDVRIPGMKGNPPYKSMVLDVDMNKKSDRVEWCTLRYHGNYTPGCSFEFEVQWMVTTPNILYDLLSGWARKAASCGFHLVPVPYDPFALPESSTHDPLRRPQFIPLQLEGCLGEGQTSLFEEFGADTHSERLQLFQETILKRFGFVRDNSRPGSGSYYLQQTTRLQFVHETGVALVQIPEYQSKAQGLQKFKTQFSRNNAETGTPNEVSDAQLRTRNPLSQSGTEEERKVGFYWTYNYVLTKRWRSSSTGEEKFGERLLADLTNFCLDEDWRLRDFWKECQHGPLESALAQ